MRELINWFKSLWCKHEFKYEEIFFQKHGYTEILKQGIKVSRTCNKCGWHKSYWKY